MTKVTENKAIVATYVAIELVHAYCIFLLTEIANQFIMMGQNNCYPNKLVSLRVTNKADGFVHKQSVLTPYANVVEHNLNIYSSST